MNTDQQAPGTSLHEPGVRSLAASTIAIFAYGLSAIGQAISMAALIFTGSLESGLPRAVASFCIAGGVLAIYVALRSRVVPAGGVIQDAPAIVLITVAAGVGLGAGDESVANVFALLFVTTMSTGVLMWLLGRFRLGGLVRYMPATVVGAFMAGTGWLLVKGGLDVMVDFGVGLADIPDLFSTDLAKFWIPGFAIGIVTWLIGRSDRLPVIAIGGTVLFCTIGFYVVVALTSSLDAVQDAGWLIGPFPDGAGPSLVTPGELASADWGRFLSEITGIVSVVAVSIMVMLLNMTGIGVSASQRLDVDAELRVAGEANILFGVLGAAPGFHGLGDTLLLKRLGARDRLVPVAAGVALIVFGVLGVSLIGFVPRLIVGALLVTVGASLLEDWVREVIHGVSRVEQILSVGIVVVIAWVGILEGIGAGLVAACAVFIVRYSRVDPIRAGGTGRAIRSRVDRSPREMQILQARSERLAVFELQGYLFFGSLTKLDDRFHGATGDHTTRGEVGGEALYGRLDATVLDFETVTGMDASGYALIGQLVAQLDDAGSLVVLSGLERHLRRALVADVPGIDGHVEWASTLDHALELAENTQLARAADVVDSANDREENSLKLPRGLLDELDEVEYHAGHVVVKQGDPSDGMFIIDEGLLTAFRVDDQGRRQRLRRFGTGAMVGEIGLITQGERTAEVVAETDVVALWLSNEHYQQLRETQPELIFLLHEFIMRGQAERMVSLSDGLTQTR